MPRLTLSCTDMINIYRISNSFDDKVYIGQTGETLEERFGHKHSEETKKKISDAQKLRLSKKV